MPHHTSPQQSSYLSPHPTPSLCEQAVELSTLLTVDRSLTNNMTLAFFLLSLLVVLLLLSSPVLSDVLRLSCGNILTIGRVDPIISPGAITSNHVHTVYGGSGFSPTVSYADLVASKCATCQLVEDNSVYWFPTLYYHNVTTNTYTSVEQSPPGAAIYYLQRRFQPDEQIVAFPPGFRMIAGSMTRRVPYTINDTNFVSPVNYVCLNYNTVSSQSDSFPNVTCEDGLRAQLSFPSCWDGVNLDSPTHTSHVSYAVTENLNSGPCPASHPVRIPALFAEVIWQTSDFPALVNGVSPFVWSFTTPTTLVGNEYGYHGGQPIAAASVARCSSVYSSSYSLYTLCVLVLLARQTSSTGGTFLRCRPLCRTAPPSTTALTLRTAPMQRHLNAGCRTWPPTRRTSESTCSAYCLR